MTRRRKLPHLPSREDVRAFLDMCDTPPSRKELYKVFGIAKRQQVHFDELLASLLPEEEKKKANEQAPPLPHVTPARVVRFNAAGEALAEPSPWKHSAPPPVIRVKGKPKPALRAQERLLLKIFTEKKGRYTGKIMRRLPEDSHHRSIIAAVEEAYGTLALRTTDKKAVRHFIPAGPMASALKPGDLVLASPLPGSRQRSAGLMAPLAEVSDVFASLKEPGGVSALAIAEHNLPHRFPEAALKQADTHKAPKAGADRVDLRDIPLVTIDGEDARDFDDAVWARPVKNPKQKGKWELLVAIADVAHYVPEGSALDVEAEKRGNSVYFPDRVVPMLPEKLSNGLCSLNPEVDRYCMAVRLWIDTRGNIVDSEFLRGIMRSHARLTYTQVQQAKDTDNRHQAVPPNIYKEVLQPLYGVYASLKGHREQRGTLELDLPEFAIRFGKDGKKVDTIEKVERLDSHCLIEECMIAANVAVARLLSLREHPGMFRVHEPPAPERIDELRETLKDFGHHLPKGDGLGGRQFNVVLNRAKGMPESGAVSTAILRSQSQAVYGEKNIGHFGLALQHYCHFTSPIRRYADLITHRAVIRLLGLGPDGLSDDAMAALESVAKHISKTERDAALAERDTRDRFAALYYRGAIGKRFEATVSGEAGIGIFVTLVESGASGLVPQRRHGRYQRKGGGLQMGERVSVRLTQTDPITGRMRFELVKEKKQAGKQPPAKKKRPARKKKPKK